MLSVSPGNVVTLSENLNYFIHLKACREAYSDDVNQATCILGCYKAREEIDHLKEVEFCDIC